MLLCNIYLYFIAKEGETKSWANLSLFISGRVLALYLFNYFLVMLGVCLEEAVKKLSSLLPCLDISNNLPLVIFISRLRCGSTDTEDEWGGEIAGRRENRGCFGSNEGSRERNRAVKYQSECLGDKTKKEKKRRMMGNEVTQQQERWRNRNVR